MAKFWFTYREQNWDLIKQGYVKLFSLAQKIGRVEEKPENIWYLSDIINREIGLYEKDSSWGLEKNYLSFLELELVDELEGLVTKFDQQKSGQAGASGKLPSELLARFTSNKINENKIKEWETKYAVAGNENKPLVLKDLELLADNLEFLAHDLILIMAAYGLVVGFGAYDPEKVVTFLKGEIKEIDPVLLLRTLRDASFGEAEARDITLAALGFLEILPIVDFLEMTWVDALNLTAILTFVFKRFDHLDDLQQKFLLNFHLYRAMVLGLPVRNYLQVELLRAPGIIQYLNLNKSFLSMLDGNMEEAIIYPAAPLKMKRIADIFKDYASTGDSLDPKVQDGFVKKVCSITPPPQPDFCAGWLKEILDIYVRLKQAQLVDWPKDHPRGLEEQYREDLMLLVASFGQAGEYVVIEDYYKNTETAVPLNALLEKLKETLDLTRPENVDNCLKFSEWLHNKKLLPADKELVVFYEKDNKFHWAD